MAGPDPSETWQQHAGAQQFDEEAGKGFTALQRWFLTPRGLKPEPWAAKPYSLR